MVVPVEVRALETPITTFCPSLRPDVISARLLVTSPTVTAWLVTEPSAPMTRTEYPLLPLTRAMAGTARTLVALATVSETDAVMPARASAGTPVSETTTA